MPPTAIPVTAALGRHGPEPKYTRPSAMAMSGHAPGQRAYFKRLLWQCLDAPMPSPPTPEYLLCQQYAGFDQHSRYLFARLSFNTRYAASMLSMAARLG